jgi:hypothetical protein
MAYNRKYFTVSGRLLMLLISVRGLAFGYPECHEEQKKLARAFQGNSAAGIECCAEAVMAC